VVADYLQQRGDPWGELISLACLPGEPTSRAARIGELQRVLAPRLWPADDLIACTWWRGFVSSIAVTDSEGPAWLADRLGRLLEAPGAMLCDELSFRDAGLGDGNVDALVGLADRIRAMSRVRFDGNRFTPPAVGRLRAAFPGASFERQGPDTFDDRGPAVLVKSWGDSTE